MITIKLVGCHPSLIGQETILTVQGDEESITTAMYYQYIGDALRAGWYRVVIIKVK